MEKPGVGIQKFRPRRCYSCISTPESERFENEQSRTQKVTVVLKKCIMGVGIIAFLTLVPIVMKSRRRATLNDRLRRGSITQAPSEVGGGGGGSAGVTRGRGKEQKKMRASPRSLHKSPASFSVFLTAVATLSLRVCVAAL